MPSEMEPVILASASVETTLDSTSSEEPDVVAAKRAANTNDDAFIKFDDS